MTGHTILEKCEYEVIQYVFSLSIFRALLEINYILNSLVVRLMDVSLLFFKSTKKKLIIGLGWI